MIENCINALFTKVFSPSVWLKPFWQPERYVTSSQTAWLKHPSRTGLDEKRWLLLGLSKDTVLELFQFAQSCSCVLVLLCSGMLFCWNANLHNWKNNISLKIVLFSSIYHSFVPSSLPPPVTANTLPQNDAVVSMFGCRDGNNTMMLTVPGFHPIYHWELHKITTCLFPRIKRFYSPRVIQMPFGKYTVVFQTRNRFSASARQ